MPKFAVLVIAHDGEQRYIRHGHDNVSGAVATWPSRRAAENVADFWRQGIGDEVASVNVVRYRNTEKGAGDAETVRS